VQALVLPVTVMPIRITLGLAEVVTRVAYLVMRDRRRITIDNIRRSGVAETEREARRIALASFRSFVVMLAEMFVLRRRMTPENWSRFAELDLDPEAEKALREPGRGCILACGHFGNWEAAACITSTIKPLCGIYRPFKNPHMNRAYRADRRGFAVKLVPRHEADPLRFLKSLKSGDVLAIMMDQHAGRRGIRVDFFGRPASTTPTVALLHLLTDAPLLYGWTVRTGPLHYRLHLEAPMRFERTGRREEDVRRVTEALTRAVERTARAHPEQYMWGHRRWK
jgi:KDO2-lipid IV(A) lauroyltransferase